MSASEGLGNKANEALQKIEADRQWARWKKRLFWTLSVLLTIFLLSCAIWDALHAQRILALRMVPVVIFALYGLVWLGFGRDARRGEIQPRSMPPKKMPPGFMECVRTRKIPMGAMANDLLWLAAKGWLRFCHCPPEGAHLRRTARADAPRSSFFRALLERLFPPGRDILYLRTFPMNKAEAFQRHPHLEEENADYGDDGEDYDDVFVGDEELARLYETYHWWEQRHQDICKFLWSRNIRLSFLTFALVFVVCEVMAWQVEKSSFMMQLAPIMMGFVLLVMFLMACLALVVGVGLLFGESYILGPLGILSGAAGIVCAIAMMFWDKGKDAMIGMFDPGVFVLLMLLLSAAVFFSWRILPRLFAAGARLQGEIEGYARHLAAVAADAGRMKTREFVDALPYVFSLGEAYAARFRAPPPEEVSRFMTPHPDVQGDESSESPWLWRSFCRYREEIIDAINNGAGRANQRRRSSTQAARGLQHEKLPDE
ncbi:MAG: DUF2207 domain-containing protein [Zoogloeaceae bacterium]|nr:DUF2207 domain-containing protein [Zoogloeaceae bacterium]